MAAGSTRRPWSAGIDPDGYPSGRRRALLARLHYLIKTRESSQGTGFDLRFPKGGTRGEDILTAIHIDGHHTAKRC